MGEITLGTCRLCNNSGWLLSVNSEELCADCEDVWAQDVEQNSRILSESLDIIDRSQNFKTRLSRAETAIHCCKRLQKYESRGIATIGTPPSEAIRRIKEAKQGIIENYVTDELLKARTKSHNAVTASGKVSPYSKVIDKIGEFYGELSDVSNLEELERETRVEMDQARLAAELEKAEKAEFKGQKKKAIDAYMDALFVIRKDSIDDAQQSDQIHEIKEKIRGLGGKIPMN